MEKFVIEGGVELSGSVSANGSKNEALPAVAATLLTEDTVTLDNIPKIQDVLVLLEIIETMGAKVEWIGEQTVTVCAADIEAGKLPSELAIRLRASLLLAGPLLARVGEVILPPPGGDVIGRRRMDTHIMGLHALGAEISTGKKFSFSTSGLQGTDIFLDEPSVTGTENVIMAAVLAEGRTVIRNAACEPHVQGLCHMLNSMGAWIHGIGTNILTIEGVERLNGCNHRVGPDYLEIGSLIGLAAVTNSALTIENTVPDDLRMISLVFNKLGVSFDILPDKVVIPKQQTMQVNPDLMDQIPQIDDAPWPMFPTDMMSIAITVATQVQGTVIFFEKMFDGRMFFTDRLNDMGAKIIMCDPHRVVVTGPSRLVGATLESPDVRAGMALLIASLCAKGTSTIYNIRQIDRGYQNIEKKLQSIGAKIERLPA